MRCISACFIGCVLLFTFQSNVEAQERERIKIIQTDSLLGSSGKTGAKRRLLGRVKLETEKAFISCDSAWHFVDQKQVVAYGAIHIKTSDEELWADRLEYDLKTEICSFSGPVRIKTKKSNLFTQNGNYNLKTKMASFVKPLFIMDEKGEISAKSGFFFTRNDSARLYGNVQLQDSLLYLEADSLISGKKSGRTSGLGNVYIRHKSEKWFVRSEKFNSDTLGNRYFERSVEYIKPDSASSDTTWMASNWLHVFQQKDSNTLTAQSNIRLWHPDYSLAADSLFYQEKSGLFQLRKAPLLWTEKRQLSGYMFDLTIQKNEIKSLFSTPQPFMAEPDSISKRFNQISADSLLIDFKDGNPQTMTWRRNVNLIFQSRKDSLSETGLIALSGSRLDLMFENKKVSKMTGSKDVSGFFSEKPDSSGNANLPGFIWKPERRPKKPDILPKPRFREQRLDSLKTIYKVRE